MKTTRFSEDVRSVTELKTQAAKIVEHACKSRRPVLLTRRGRGVAVLLDLEEYEDLVERKAFVEAVEAGARSVSTRKLHSDDEAMKILESFDE